MQEALIIAALAMAIVLGPPILSLMLWARVRNLERTVADLERRLGGSTTPPIAAPVVSTPAEVTPTVASASVPAQPVLVPPSAPPMSPTPRPAVAEAVPPAYVPASDPWLTSPGANTAQTMWASSVKPMSTPYLLTSP